MVDNIPKLLYLDDQNHPYRVSFQINGIQETQVELQWSPINDTMRRFNADFEVATEYGAYGIAALLMPYLTGLTVIERSIKGKSFGFDFWFGSIDDPNTLFHSSQQAMLTGALNP